MYLPYKEALNKREEKNINKIKQKKTLFPGNKKKNKKIHIKETHINFGLYWIK